MHALKKSKIFYGYWVLAAAFCCLFIESGCAVYAVSIFVKPLESDLGWGRGEIMAAFTLYFIITGVAAPFIGSVVDRYGARGVVFAGAFISGLGLALLSLTNDLWFFYLGYIVTGAGMAAMGPVPLSAVIANWFKKRRGTAIGIMSTGMGIGAFALAPLIGGYLIPNYGWRISYLVLALLTWVLIIPLALLVIKTRPADMGLYPDDIEPSVAHIATEASPRAYSGSTLRSALATLPFWLIATSFTLSAFAQDGVVQSQVPYLVDIGFSITIAATALGAVAFMSAIGKLGFGWLCDLIPVKHVWCIALVFQLGGTIILINVGPTSPTAIIWLYAIVMGLSTGGWLPTMSMLTSTTFGLASYGAIFGMVNLLQHTGNAIGPFMAGYMYDVMESYHRAFVIFIALCIVAIIAIMPVRRSKSPQNLKEYLN